MPQSDVRFAFSFCGPDREAAYRKLIKQAIDSSPTLFTQEESLLFINDKAGGGTQNPQSSLRNSLCTEMGGNCISLFLCRFSSISFQGAYDSVLTRHVGDLGRWQLVTFLLVSVVIFNNGYINLGQTFLFYEQEFRCQVEQCDTIGNTEYEEGNFSNNFK